MNNFKVDKRTILKRISRVLKWENKPSKLKRSIAHMKITSLTFTLLITSMQTFKSNLFKYFLNLDVSLHVCSVS